ncbi:PREDICTED: proline-rich proteoglycan 2-like, partial [Chinchilla lanigera]|uniref:proline-rich proteoglycan 2-like n=1 Tax=Chinchilla lanigera TaxID=34839 RepID=UPI000698730E
QSPACAPHAEPTPLQAVSRWAQPHPRGEAQTVFSPPFPGQEPSLRSPSPHHVLLPPSNRNTPGSGPQLQSETPKASASLSGRHLSLGGTLAGGLSPLFGSPRRHGVQAPPAPCRAPHCVIPRPPWPRGRFSQSPDDSASSHLLRSVNSPEVASILHSSSVGPPNRSPPARSRRPRPPGAAARRRLARDPGATARTAAPAGRAVSAGRRALPAGPTAPGRGRSAASRTPPSPPRRAPPQGPRAPGRFLPPPLSGPVPRTPEGRPAPSEPGSDRPPKRVHGIAAN